MRFRLIFAVLLIFVLAGCATGSVEDVLRAFGFAVIAALVARIVFNVLNRNTLCRISNLRASTLVSLMVKLSD